MRASRGSVFVIALVITAVFSPSGAEEEPPGQKSRRTQALADLDKEVGALAKLVKNVDKMSPCGAAPAAPARGGRHAIARKVGGSPFCPAKYAPIKQKLKDLIGVVSANSGHDDRAGAVISFWPQFVESFGSQLDNLANMKVNHKSAVEAGKQCKATGDAMVARAKAALSNKSLDEFQAARDQAEKDQTVVREWVSKQESIANSMDQWRRNTELFKPAGPHDKAWKPVYQAMHASSKKMDEQWLSDWAKASTLCAEPNKGEDHAEHKKLEDQLFETLRKDLDTDLAAWRDEAKVLYRHDCDSMKKLHESYCDDLDGDGEEVDLESQFEAQADAMKLEMEAKVNAASAKLDDLRTRAGIIQARRNGRMASVTLYQAWQADVDTFIAAVDVEKKALDEVVANGIARGARNPKIALWISFGKQQHLVMEEQSQFACTLKDESFCAERDADGKCKRWKRPDCLSVTQCKIWEFKPPGSKAKARGDTQVSGYETILETHYNFALDLFREDNLSFTPVGGMDVLKELDRQCAHGGKLDLDKDVAQYARCGAEVEYTCAPQAK